MNAAKISSEYAANILLNFSTAHLLNRNYRIMANPNVTDGEGFTGLSFALKTNNIEIINMFADVTIEGVDINLKLLVQSNLEIDGKLETYVQKILEVGKIQQLFEMSSFFGNPQFLDYLLNNNRSNHSKQYGTSKRHTNTNKQTEARSLGMKLTFSNVSKM